LGFVRGQTEQVEIWSLLVPIRMRRPAATLETLSRSPLMEAGGTHASSAEWVPFMPTVVGPAVSWRPAAERASDARAGRVEALVEIGFAVD